MPSLVPSRLVLALAIVAAAAAWATTAPASRAQVPPVAPAASLPVDPVSAAVAEASRRFGVPESWIRSVMRVESAGNRVAVSHAGAMGLMQVMPATYAGLRLRYGLGADPFDVRDNVLAGTAYLREMFDLYGAPGFLAAYNAGPGRWEAYATGRRALPGETAAYLAKLAPMIGVEAPAAITDVAGRSIKPPVPASVFVTVESASNDGAEASDAARLRQIVAANTTLVPPSEELFVRRPSVSQPRVEPSSTMYTTIRRSVVNNVGETPIEAPLSPPNTLFAPRLLAGGVR